MKYFAWAIFFTSVAPSFIYGQLPKVGMTRTQVDSMIAGQYEASDTGAYICYAPYELFDKSGVLLLTYDTGNRVTLSMWMRGDPVTTGINLFSNMQRDSNSHFAQIADTFSNDVSMTEFEILRSILSSKFGTFDTLSEDPGMASWKDSSTLHVLHWFKGSLDYHEVALSIFRH